jgi:hypothetical protein
MRFSRTPPAELSAEMALVWYTDWSIKALSM